MIAAGALGARKVCPPPPGLPCGFVIVRAPPRSDLQAELRSIRRSTTAHVIPTHAFCLLAGGPKLVFSMGADGLQVKHTLLRPCLLPRPCSLSDPPIALSLQIPADKLYKLMMQQSRSYGPVKQLPPRERVIGASLLIAGGTVGAGIIALPVKTAAAGFIPSVAAMAGVRRPSQAGSFPAAGSRCVCRVVPDVHART